MADKKTAVFGIYPSVSQAERAVDTLAVTVDRNRTKAAEVLRHAASTIKDGARGLTGGRGVAQLAEAAAEGIDTTAQYVRERNTRQMMSDLKQLVKRHPGAWVVGAAVVGVLVGRGFRKH